MSETTVENFLGNQILVHANLHMMTLVSASLIIDECSKWQPNGEHSNDPTEGILNVLRSHVNWANHGFINALQSHVDIVYAYQKAAMDGKAFTADKNEAILICKALDTYQEWKEQIVKKEKKIYGAYWGDATGFTKAKWNENNEKFLALWRS